MMGTEENPGVNRRAIRELLRVCSQRDAVNYTMSVSLLEIYNDTLVDLVSNVPAGEQNLLIRIDPKTKKTFVPGLTWRVVASEEDIVNVINEGESNRTVAFTKMNATSSRSHLLLSITVVGEDSVSGNISTGKLTMVDLAGSERISKSEVTGKELAEAVAINKSLSSLGQVFVGLQSNQAHIPYRNSKLTHILQESLGGDAKACVFINISPARSNLQETMSTLQFGSDIRKIEIRTGGKGTPKTPRKNSAVPNTESTSRRGSSAPPVVDNSRRRPSTAPRLGSAQESTWK
jgi:kinesin family protein C2/C3